MLAINICWWLLLVFSGRIRRILEQVAATVLPIIIQLKIPLIPNTLTAHAWSTHLEQTTPARWRPATCNAYWWYQSSPNPTSKTPGPNYWETSELDPTHSINLDLNNKQALTKLTFIQRIFLLQISRSYQTISTDALQAITVIPPIAITLNTTKSRICNLQHDHATNINFHNTSIQHKVYGWQLHYRFRPGGEAYLMALPKLSS